MFLLISAASSYSAASPAGCSQPASRPKQSRTISLSKHKAAIAQAAAAVETGKRAPSDEPEQQPKRQRTGPLPTSLYLGESVLAVVYAGVAAGTISISSESLQLLEDKLQYWSESKPAAAGDLFGVLQGYHNSIPVEHRGMQVPDRSIIAGLSDASSGSNVHRAGMVWYHFPPKGAEAHIMAGEAGGVLQDTFNEQVLGCSWLLAEQARLSRTALSVGRFMSALPSLNSFLHVEATPVIMPANSCGLLGSDDVQQQKKGQQILEDQLDVAIAAGVEVHLVWSGTAADAAASMLEADSIEVDLCFGVRL